jgi:murein DD-endopeptidase MepM/ murein hydrolase activator NlpD
LIALQELSTEVPSATPWPTATPTITPSPTPTATETFTPQPTASQLPPTAYPTNTPRPTQIVLGPTYTAPAAFATFDAQNADAPLLDHYWLARPFPRDPNNSVKDFISRNYPYGSTGSEQFKPHHGVDISNPVGTNILAVADGWVVYAGSDDKEMFGPQLDFYGNLVVIEHDMLAPNRIPLYTLYGHMSNVEVQTGQRVHQGDKIGEVGATGVALGAHLHLEVRIGDPHDYGSTYNPDLWLRPWNGFGTLAGRITDQLGNRLYDTEIGLISDLGSTYSGFSYAYDELNSDPYYGETYARGDLPQGEYQVIVRIHNVKRFEATVTIENGKTTWLDIVIN